MFKTIRISVLLSLFFISCARQLSPTGGPDDTIGPVVTASFPTQESVNVPVETRINLTFSEWLSTKSDRSVTIYPQIPLRVKFSGNHLEIIPQKKLADSTTYHIAINSILQDLHGNSIRFPYNLIFSTGPTLDSGSIRGCVTDPSRTFFQPKVALFRSGLDTMYFGSPSYLVQTDSSGIFNVDHVRNGNYRIIAFVDANGDSRFEPAAEQLFIPEDSSIYISGSRPDTLKLFPAIADTSSSRIISVKSMSHSTIVGQFDHPLDTSIFKTPQFLCKLADTSTTLKITSSLLSSSGSSFAILLKDTLKDKPYDLIYRIDSRNHSLKNFIDTVNLTGSNLPDTVRPVLVSPTSIKGTNLQPKIYLVWSELVRISDTLYMKDSTGNSIMIMKSLRGFSDTTIFKPEKRLVPETDYHIVIFSSDGKDLAGNPLKAKDSTDTSAVINVRTLESDGFATSLRGGATCLSQKADRKWIFSLFERKDTFLSPDSNGNFFFELIPAGKGNLSFFEDKNGNDMPDPGRLIPWRAPEPYFTLRDTIEARARWEIEGISISPCGACPK